MDKSEIWQFMFLEYPCEESGARGHNPVPDPALVSLHLSNSDNVVAVEYDLTLAPHQCRLLQRK